MTLISEWHSGDLTTACMRAVKLTHEGRYKAEMQSAMYRGLVAGDAIGYLHLAGAWNDATIQACVLESVAKAQRDMAEEDRQFSEAVVKNADALHKDILRVVTLYRDRFAERFQKCELVGVELPIRVALADDRGAGWHENVETVQFASHLDLLIYDEDGVWGRGKGRHLFWDWKYTDDNANRDYLGRQPQFILYTIGIRRGQVQLPDGTWTRLETWADGCWCWLAALKPYGKKLTTKDDAGELREYKRGDERPERAILTWTDYRPDRERDMMRELLVRPRMARAGFFPAHVDKVGCMLCNCREFCDRFDMAKLDYGDRDDRTDDQSAANALDW